MAFERVGEIKGNWQETGIVTYDSENNTYWFEPIGGTRRPLPLDLAKAVFWDSDECGENALESLGINLETAWPTDGWDYFTDKSGTCYLRQSGESLEIGSHNEYWDMFVSFDADEYGIGRLKIGSQGEFDERVGTRISRRELPLNLRD